MIFDIPITGFAENPKLAILVVLVMAIAVGIFLLLGLIADWIVSAAIKRFKRPVAIHSVGFWIGYLLRVGWLSTVLFMPVDMFGHDVTMLDDTPAAIRGEIGVGDVREIQAFVGFLQLCTLWMIWTMVFDTIRLARIAGALYAHRAERLRW